jgi:hypothetical protein
VLGGRELLRVDGERKVRGQLGRRSGRHRLKRVGQDNFQDLTVSNCSRLSAESHAMIDDLKPYAEYKDTGLP